MFVRWGIPLEQVIDHAKFTSAEFQDFCRERGFVHTTASPHDPQVNGAAERAVQIAKNILKQPDPHFAMVCYRQPPVPPRAWVLRYLWLEERLDLHFPCWRTNSKLHRWTDNRFSRWTTRQRQLIVFSMTAVTLHNHFPHYSHCVRIKLDGEKGWKTPARVIGKCKEPRSYLVETENGAVLWRNRRHQQVVPQHQLQSPGSPVLPGLCSGLFRDSRAQWWKLAGYI